MPYQILITILSNSLKKSRSEQAFLLERVLFLPTQLRIFRLVLLHIFEYVLWSFVIFKICALFILSAFSWMSSGKLAAIISSTPVTNIRVANALVI